MILSAAGRWRVSRHIDLIQRPYEPKCASQVLWFARIIQDIQQLGSTPVPPGFGLGGTALPSEKHA